MKYTAFRSIDYNQNELDYIDSFGLDDMTVEAENQESAKDELCNILTKKGFTSYVTENRNEVVAILPNGLEVCYYGFSAE